MREASERPRSPAHDLAPNPAIAVARLFVPDEIDLDGLAEAVRLLLESDNTPRTRPKFARPAHLLSRRPRVTHVVEATATH